MPVLTFELPPPDRSLPMEQPSPPKLAPSRDIKDSSTIVQDVDAPLTNAYPLVRLDVDVISEAAASRLAASLLGHVLFLKNQIPFPVLQLGRIPGGKTNSRAAKLRTELMASYDTVSSHLDTTFSALAIALARCSGPHVHSQSAVTQAHVAILVGPSLGSAKAKVIMGIDGLEKKVWGLRTDTAQSENSYDSSDEEAEEDADAEDTGSDEEGEEVPADSEDEDDEDEQSESEDNDAEEEEENDHEDDEGGEDDGDGDADGESEAPDLEHNEDHESAPPPPYVSYAEEQKFLRSTDRLLSRVLAAADAEGNGIACEMSPTQTHILIRAPRIFKHPAWVPRQNISSSLDATLADFFSASGVDCPPNLQAPAAKGGSTKRSKVEGVWVTTRDGIHPLPQVKAEVDHGRELEQGTRKVKVGLPAVTNEDAEMIWWSWDGKFTGFSDW